jgi:hypothetical protein
MTMEFHELSPEERTYIVQEELGRVRFGLSTPAPTRVVADRISRTLGWPSADVGRILVRNLARAPYARQAGIVKRYGKPMKRWEWLPEENAGQVPSDLLA